MQNSSPSDSGNRKSGFFGELLAKPNFSCPFAVGQVDGNGARLVAAQTVLLLILWVITNQPWYIPLFLIVDFAMRSYSSTREYSPQRAVARILLQIFKVKPKMTNLGPKQFAARIGLAFSLALLILTVLGLTLPALILALIFAFFALLEALFAFCVGCLLYSLIFRKSE